MKRLIVLLCVVTYCLCLDEYREKEHEREDGRYYDDRYDDDDKYYDNDTNGTETAEYRKHLCPKRDLPCVRQVLSETFDCKPLVKRRGDRYFYDNIRIDIPQANSSFIWGTSIANGFRDFSINELFINKKTRTLIFEVVFQSIVVNSPKSTFVLYRRGMEPIYTSDFVNVNYRNISLTLIVENQHDPKKTTSHIYTFVNEAIPPFSIGPRFVPADPTAVPLYRQLITNIPANMKEVFVTQGPKFFTFFLNTAICELNIKTVPYP